MAMLLMTLGDT